MGQYSVTFTRLVVHCRKTMKCKCGNRFVRSMSFEQTLNPFNADPTGVPKTDRQIYRENDACARKWANEPERCPKCKAKCVPQPNAVITRKVK